MNLELTNKQLKAIVDQFDTDRIDFNGDLRQSFEIEDAITTWTKKVIDASIEVYLIQTNNRLECESIEFSFEAFYFGFEGVKLDIIFEAEYLTELEKELKSKINGNR